MVELDSFVFNTLSLLKEFKTSSAKILDQETDAEVAVDKWVSLQGDGVKMNVDASFRGGAGGVGVVIRLDRFWFRQLFLCPSLL